MFELHTIGEIVKDDDSCFIYVRQQYHKALKYVDKFSHIHVFYDDKEENVCKLKSAIVIIKSVSKQGIEADLSNSIVKGTFQLFDIKPVFPSEDCVKESSIDKEVTSQVNIIQQDNETFHIDSCGTIRITDGESYIQFDNLPQVYASHVTVLWWFHKFDDKKFRNVCECNPPYENAKRSGIFATRSPVRPNPIAMTVCRVTKVDKVNNRVYLHSIECFDKTPCIGILMYDRKVDCVTDAKVPEWLAHWPKWLDEGNEQKKLPDDTMGMVEDLIGEQNKVNKEMDFCLEQRIEAPDGLVVKGAYENNLKNVSVTIPYNKITAVIGVSGSGKSSLVQDTIYTECRRRMEYLSHDRNIFQKPKMESMNGVIPGIMISQKQIGANVLSTIGTYSSAYDHLRTIYAQIGISHCPVCKQEIIPLSVEKIIEILQEFDKITLYDLEDNEISKGHLDQRVEEALTRGKGAFFANIKGKKYLFQTKKKCYRCDRIMFDLSPATFSYIDQDSRCPNCKGYGVVLQPDVQRIIEHPEKSILDGASSFWGNLRKFREYSNANWMKGEVLGLADKMGIDLNKTWNEYPDDFKQKVLNGSSGEIVTFTYHNEKNSRTGTIERPVEGVINILKRLYAEHGNHDSIQKYFSMNPCQSCNGERLNEVGRLVTMNGIRYPEAAKMTFTQVMDFCKNISNSISENEYELVRSSIQSLYLTAKSACSLGIGHLNLDRTTTHISGGEGQRLKLLTVMQNDMSGILYVFDEPSKGLHPKDYASVICMMKQLREKGNTVLMVEHNEDMIKIADYFIEIGPGAGYHGGIIIGQGSLMEMKQNEKSQFYNFLNRKFYNSKKTQNNYKFLSCEHLRKNNLKDITIHFPQHALTCICGVSGSGKSTLMKQEIYEYFRNTKTFSEVVIVDQAEIGRTIRSILATYINIMDSIRIIFSNTLQAKELGYDDKVFSFNNEDGQCECCKGSGRIKNDFIEDSWTVCPLCKGKRYKKNILNVKYKDRNIDDVLNLSVEEAILFFDDVPEIKIPLQMMQEVGLSYLKLGQSTLSLSGGEAARIKLGKQLMEKNNVLYLLDEPTTGLHFSDVEHLMSLLRKLIGSGNTIVAIEHNKLFLNNADWMIELGPGAGEAGGIIISEGKNTT